MSSTSGMHDKFDRFMNKVRSDNQLGIKLDDLKEEPPRTKNYRIFYLQF
jgi:hypothetical protein